MWNNHGREEDIIMEEMRGGRDAPNRWNSGCGVGEVHEDEKIGRETAVLSTECLFLNGKNEKVVACETLRRRQWWLTMQTCKGSKNYCRN